MTIAETDREIRELIQKHHVYGAGAVINALVRAAQDEKYLTEEAICTMVHTAFRFERELPEEVTT